MYQLLALANGVILAIMISVNGGLSERFNIFTAAAIIHAVGTLFALLLCFLQKNKKPLWKHGPKWIYLGGAIGVFTTVFQNMAIGYISITSVIALGLLGQTAMSLIIDEFGLFGMEKRPFPPYALVGLGFSVLGILVMCDTTLSTAILAVGISFASGISMVLSRTVNARLAEKTGALRGSLINHAVGLPITILLALSADAAAGMTHVISGGSSFKPWIYLGGVLGVIVVMLLNIIVPKVPAFQVTLLIFTGQVAAGILLDILVGIHDSGTSFTGGIFISFGIAINMILERVQADKARKYQEYLTRIEENEEAYRRYMIDKYCKKAEE